MTLNTLRRFSVVPFALVAYAMVCSCDQSPPAASAESQSGSTDQVVEHVERTRVGERVQTVDHVELYSHIARACDYVKSSQEISEVTLRQDGEMLTAGPWARTFSRQSLDELQLALRDKPGQSTAIRALPAATGFSHGDSLGEIPRGAWILELVSNERDALVMKASYRSSSSGNSR